MSGDVNPAQARLNDYAQKGHFQPRHRPMANWRRADIRRAWAPACPARERSTRPQVPCIFRGPVGVGDTITTRPLGHGQECRRGRHASALLGTKPEGRRVIKRRARVSRRSREKVPPAAAAVLPESHRCMAARVHASRRSWNRPRSTIRWSPPSVHPRRRLSLARRHNDPAARRSRMHPPVLGGAGKRNAC